MNHMIKIYAMGEPSLMQVLAYSFSRTEQVQVIINKFREKLQIYSFFVLKRQHDDAITVIWP